MAQHNGEFKVEGSATHFFLETLHQVCQNWGRKLARLPTFHRFRRLYSRCDLKLTCCLRDPNQIYLLCIDSTTFKHEIEWKRLCRRKSFVAPTILALSQTCRQIRLEFLPLCISTITIKVRLAQLDSYLQNFYPLLVTKRLHVYISLIFPDKCDRWQSPRFWRDITGLVKVMAQNEHLKCTIAHVSETCEAALEEAQELDGFLRNIRREAPRDSITSVQLLSRRADWSEKDRRIVVPGERPVILVTFREHCALPGEWPWYGAHDLNHESLTIWTEWMTDIKRLV